MPNLEKFIDKIHFGQLKFSIPDIKKILKDNTYLDVVFLKIIKRRYFYLNKKVDYTILNILIYFIFSKNFGEVVRYLSLTHPSLQKVVMNIPKDFYYDIVNFALKEQIPILFYKNYRIEINPILTTNYSIELDTGFAATILILKKLLIHIKKRAEEQNVDIKEHIEDFLYSMKDNNITNTMIGRYNTLKKEYIMKSKAKEYKEKYGEAPRSYGIIPKTIDDLTIIPCMKNIIQRQYKNIEISHWERVVFLSIAQVFLTDEQIHEFFKYNPDYSYKDTQYYINYTRSNWDIPNNCKGIIKRDLCTCGGPPGCCGTTVYKAFRLPTDIIERVSEYYEKKGK